jgi:hypothetical protein
VTYYMRMLQLEFGLYSVLRASLQALLAWHAKVSVCSLLVCKVLPVIHADSCHC